MTKFDLATWFCKIVALVGIIHAVLSLLGCLCAFIISSGLHWGNVVFYAIVLGANIFVWLFAEGIAAKLSGEDRTGETKLSRPDSLGLLVQCLGFWLLLNGFISSSHIGLSMLYYRQSMPTSSYITFMGPILGVGLVEALLGFILAFGPCLAQRFRSH